MHKFNPDNLEKLNNPEREKIFPVEAVADMADLKDPKIIIDIGAGTGFFSIGFSKLFPDSKIYACDTSDKMVDWMKNNISMYPSIIPTKMDDSKVPLNGGIADFIFMVNLHHELDYPDKTLEECYRLLKPGGKIAISDWKKEESDHGPAIEFRKTPEEVTNQLQKAGFKQLSTKKTLPNNFLIIGEL